MLIVIVLSVVALYSGKWIGLKATKRSLLILFREPLIKGRLSTVDLLLLIILDQLIFNSNILFAFLTKQSNLMRRYSVQSISLWLDFPALSDMGISLFEEKKLMKRN